MVNCAFRSVVEVDHRSIHLKEDVDHADVESDVSVLPITVTFSTVITESVTETIRSFDIGLAANIWRGPAHLHLDQTWGWWARSGLPGEKGACGPAFQRLGIKWSEVSVICVARNHGIYIRTAEEVRDLARDRLRSVLRSLESFDIGRIGNHTTKFLIFSPWEQYKKQTDDVPG